MRCAIVLSLFLMSATSAGAASAQEPAAENGIIPIPEGWVFVRMTDGGFVMERDDGARFEVAHCQCGSGYRVGMAIEYVRDGRRVRETMFEWGEGSSRMSIGVRIWPNGRREVRHLRAPWPEHIRQAFLRLLDSATTGQSR